LSTPQPVPSVRRSLITRPQSASSVQTPAPVWKARAMGRVTATVAPVQGFQILLVARRTLTADRYPFRRSRPRCCCMPPMAPNEHADREFEVPCIVHPTASQAARRSLALSPGEICAVHFQRCERFDLSVRSNAVGYVGMMIRPSKAYPRLDT